MKEWRRLPHVEFYTMYSSPNSNRVFKLRMKWVVHAARIGERRGAHRVLVGKRDGKKPHLEDLGVVGG
jgi:hypothetical protein